MKKEEQNVVIYLNIELVLIVEEVIGLTEGGEDLVVGSHELSDAPHLSSEPPGRQILLLHPACCHHGACDDSDVIMLTDLPLTILIYLTMPKRNKKKAKEH